jgi:hypothetical protein
MDCAGRRPGSHPRTSRRRFLRGAAGFGGLLVAPGVLASAPPGLTGPAVAVSHGGRRWSPRNVRHVVVDYDRQALCGHPRLGGIKAFGAGELVVLYCRAACAYKAAEDVSPSPIDGYLSRADVVLRRSLDGGQKWLPENEVVVWSNGLPLGKQTEFFCQDPAARPILDMCRPEAVFFFGRTLLPVARKVTNTRQGYVCEFTISDSGRSSRKAAGTLFQIRSADKGHTWERQPWLFFDRPPGVGALARANHPPATMPDGALVAAVESDAGLWLYGSDSHGMAWQYLSLIAMGQPAPGRPCSAGLVRLPSGRLQCYFRVVEGNSGRLCLSESDDGFSWTVPRTIGEDLQDPWPLRLGDGRIVVLGARQQSPPGILAMVSRDDGQTWSEPAVIRSAASGADIGFPAAVEVDPGRVFAAYQYQAPDGNGLGGTRSVSGSLFELG